MMRALPWFTEPFTDKRCAELYATGISLQKVSMRLGCCVGRVKAALQRQGVEIRWRGRPKKIGCGGAGAQPCSEE